jgi:hypothetical protein
MKAFYSNQLRDIVVNEMCKCNHLKSEHGSLLHKLLKAIVREPNDGGCCSSHCDCKQFTFSRYVCVDEAADIVMSHRLKMT